jgi:hypothetical protein
VVVRGLLRDRLADSLRGWCGGGGRSSSRWVAAGRVRAS